MTTRYEVLAYMVEADRPLSCTEIGEHFWGTVHRTRQAYARPAGAAIKRLRKEGLVFMDHSEKRIKYKPTLKGLRKCRPGGMMV